MLDFYKQMYPVARKEHTCEFCHCIIQKGKRYSCETGKYDGEMFTRNLCSECSAILHDYCKEYGYEEFDWWGISDWLRDNHCLDCENMDNCSISPEQCCRVKEKYPNEIPHSLYENVI